MSFLSFAVIACATCISIIAHVPVFIAFALCAVINLLLFKTPNSTWQQAQGTEASAAPPNICPTNSALSGHNWAIFPLVFREKLLEKEEGTNNYKMFVGVPVPGC